MSPAKTIKRDPSPSRPANSFFVDDAQARSHPAARKLCVRHQRMADEGTNLRLQQVSLFTPHALMRRRALAGGRAGVIVRSLE